MNDELLNTLVRRELAQPADPAIQRALAMIGQPINPVEVVDTAALKDHYRTMQPGISDDTLDFNARLVGGFRYPRASDPRIFINANTPLYKDAAKRPKDPIANMNLARTLVHEQIHNTEWGAEGEYAAKRKEADWYREQIQKLPRSLRAQAEDELKILELRAQFAERAALTARKGGA